MTPTLILTVILTLVAVRPFFEIPDARAKAAALKRAEYTPSAKQGCMYMLLIPVLVTLWWWYAISTDTILLGVIPTVGAAATILSVTIEHVSAKAAAA